ncbi:uncharacterized protein E0L32_005452 [Thyridium curvatum]|uniref:ferric-chelate reductase (NADPH) n=1 Tax=Thyridium curvatum TaxID=1093900 RepID=A0A507BCC3_9PEZI|nr:uncharacterized protein E0L32_005452 [Thyridium curvatum]TPX14488.1 hypothetical protein E0L32_005452 [Thyridium curvatum]
MHSLQPRRLAAAEPSILLQSFQLRDATSTASISTTTASAPAANPTIAPYHTGLNGVSQHLNLVFKDALWWSLGVVALIILGIRLGEIAWSKLRLVSAMSVAGEKQAYWRVSQWSRMPSLKKNLIYAPLWKKRHNREFRLSSAINMGTLPTRLQAILLGLYLGSNVVYMFVLNWANENRYSFCAELRGRSGTLAAVNMVPLIILASRNNPLIGMLKISFDTYNLIHRWMGRTVAIEVIIHTVAWAVVQLADGGWPALFNRVLHDRFIASGTAGTIAFVILVILSISPLRHAFYETFLNTHIILAFIIVVCTWVHCATAEIPGGLPQLPWVIAIVLLWIAERLARMIRLAFCNWSDRGFTEAIVEPLPGDTCRVTMHLARYVDVKPGQHAYLRFGGVNPWENHPFSIACWEHKSVERTLPINEKQISTATDKSNMVTSVSFLIGAQTGFTRKLYNKARQESQMRPDGRFAVALRAAFEGPYAGHHSLDSYGHAVLIAGATGITHQMSYLRHLIQGYNDGIVATRRVTLIWVMRDHESLEWVRGWMDEVLRLPGRKHLLRIHLFITRPKNPAQINSQSNTVRISPGRPNIPLIIRKEVSEQVGAMCVTVCGPGALADDVRSAVREVQSQGNVVSLHEEAFTW